MQLLSVYYNHARSINVVLLLLCISALTANMVVRWRLINRRTRRILGWLYLILINLTYGYVITIREHRPFNPSVLIATILLTGLFLSLLWHPEGDDEKQGYDNAIGTRLLYWLDRHVRAYKARRRRKKMNTPDEDLPDDTTIEEPNLADLPSEEPDGEWQDSAMEEPADDPEDDQ